MIQHARVAHHAKSRGMAALTAVMVLFFVMALVAAYTNRNLVFEQRISANSYRATRALEAADAGLEWAVAMLNTGRTTANCNRPEAGVAGGFNDFRSRYLVPAANEANGEGAFDLAWGQNFANRVYPACVIVDGALRCICPSVGQAPADINAPADGIGSAFRITFHLFNDDTARGGAMQLVSRGCGNPGAGDNACFAQRDDLPAVDSTTAVIATVGLVRALPVAPKAALTAGGAVDATVGGLQIGNGAGTADMAIQAGRTVTASAASRVRGPAGSGASEPESIGEAEARGLVVQNAKDDTGALWTNGLLSVQGVAEQRWFRALFVLDRQSYQRQPATVRLNCAAGCNSAAIANALLLNPRNPIWAEGNVDLDGANPLGTAADPMMLIVNGNLTISGNAALSGFVHANQINWSAAAATWDGAIVTSGDFTATTVASIRYDKAMLDTIRLRYGSFVRAPGGWNLY